MRLKNNLRFIVNSGFSLVEIMVGLVIGMLAVIVIMQVFALSEERKRTTTGAGDAQSNGAITFYQLQRDIGQAGYGISGTDLFNCSVTWTLGDTGTSIATPVPLAPVTINPAVSTVPAGDVNTDTLLVMYGNSDGQPQGNVISGSVDSVYTVQMPTSFKLGDKVIAAPASCGATTLAIDKVSAQNATTVTLGESSGGSNLYNLGPSPTIVAYAIRGGNLTACNYMLHDCGLADNVGKPDVWVTIANNMVSLRAIYWKDTSATMDGIADADGHNQTKATTACEWARTSAVSIALVARSTEYDKQEVSGMTPPVWTENATLPIVSGADLLGPGNVAGDWKHYRYKVFEAPIPLRNIAWLGRPAGC